jgi:hypothetical protein
VNKEQILEFSEKVKRGEVEGIVAYDLIQVTSDELKRLEHDKARVSAMICFKAHLAVTSLIMRLSQAGLIKE